MNGCSRIGPRFTGVWRPTPTPSMIIYFRDRIYCLTLSIPSIMNGFIRAKKPKYLQSYKAKQVT